MKPEVLHFVLYFHSLVMKLLQTHDTFALNSEGLDNFYCGSVRVIKLGTDSMITTWFKGLFEVCCNVLYFFSFRFVVINST